VLIKVGDVEMQGQRTDKAYPPERRATKVEKNMARMMQMTLKMLNSMFLLLT